MRRKMLLLSVAVFITSLLSAQKEKDFILTMTKDTLYGKIKHHGGSNTISFHYRGDKVEFHASTIEHFGVYQRGKLHAYKTIHNEMKKDVFVEVLSEGKINLYRYNTSGDLRYEKEDSFRYLICEDDKLVMRLSPRSYKNVLNIYIKNQPALLAQRIAFEDVPRIVAEYNHLALSTTTD